MHPIINNSLLLANHVFEIRYRKVRKVLVAWFGSTYNYRVPAMQARRLVKQDRIATGRA